jgi:hypothetical protein
VHRVSAGSIERVNTESKGENKMTLLVRTLTAIAAGSVITAGAFAQNAMDLRGPTPPTIIPHESPSKSIVEPIADAQQQARDLLTGAHEHQVRVAHESPSLALDEDRTNSIDAQEQARRLILGTSAFGNSVDRMTTPTTADSPWMNRHTTSDPHELARRMILGEEDAKNPRPKRSASAAQGVHS